jgi:hypothetical protein
MDTLHEDVWQYLAEFVLESEMFQTEFVVKIKTYFFFVKFFSENHAGYEITWKNNGTARHAADYSITRRMRFACCIAKAIDTLSM